MKTQKEISNLNNSGESYFKKWYLKTPEDLQRGKAGHSPLAARARHREHFYLSGHQTSSQCDHMTLKCKCLYYVDFALYNNIKSLSIHILKLKGEKHYMRFFENAHIIHKVSTSKPAPTVSNYTAVCAAPQNPPPVTMSPSENLYKAAQTGLQPHCCGCWGSIPWARYNPSPKMLSSSWRYSQTHLEGTKPTIKRIKRKQKELTLFKTTYIFLWCWELNLGPHVY